MLPRFTICFMGVWCIILVWSLLNRFRTEQGHCGACRRKWRLTDTDLCPCGETQTMSHIVEYCPLTKLNGGLSRLQSADEDAVSWLTNYGKWHSYEKKTGIISSNAGFARVLEISWMFSKFWIPEKFLKTNKVLESPRMCPSYHVYFVQCSSCEIFSSQCTVIQCY